MGFIISALGAWYLVRRGSGQTDSGADNAVNEVGGGDTVPAIFAEHTRQEQEQKTQFLEQIMTYAREHGGVSNDEVQKLTNVSDATATRYLQELEEQGKLKQEGNTGRGVRYAVI